MDGCWLSHWPLMVMLPIDGSSESFEHCEAVALVCREIEREDSDGYTESWEKADFPATRLEPLMRLASD